MLSLIEQLFEKTRSMISDYKRRSSTSVETLKEKKKPQLKLGEEVIKNETKCQWKGREETAS